MGKTLSGGRVALVLVAVLLVGCGGESGQDTGGGGRSGKGEASPKRSQKTQSDGKDLRHLRVTLEGLPDAENVAIFMADQRGYFADAGLAVDVGRPVDSDNVPGYVAGGTVAIGLLPQPELVLAREKGMPLVAIGSLVQRPTMAMIWLRESKINDIADLEGKTIALNGLPVEEGLLRTVLAQGGLTLDDVKIERLGYLLVPPLAQGRADAIFGGSGNVEGAELEARGLEPVITPVQELGIPSYEELVVFTRRDRLSRDSRWFHAFMAAVSRGTAAAIADPEAAAEAISIQEELEFVEPRQQPVLMEAKVKATLPLLSVTGRMSHGRATHLVDWMREQGLIQREMSSAALLTNRFVGP